MTDRLTDKDRDRGTQRETERGRRAGTGTVGEGREEIPSRRDTEKVSAPHIHEKLLRQGR